MHEASEKTAALIGRKLYLTPEIDQWLEDNFGKTRGRSRAVVKALEAFRDSVEAVREARAITRIETPEQIG